MYEQKSKTSASLFPQCINRDLINQAKSIYFLIFGNVL